VVDSLAFTGSYTSGSFTLSADGHGGTDISFVDGASALRDFAPPGIAEVSWEDAGVPPGTGWVATQADPRHARRGGVRPCPRSECSHYSSSLAR